MKNLKFLFVAMFTMLISASCIAQNGIPERHNQPQYLKSVPTYSSGSYTKVVWNTTTSMLESTPNTLLSGKVVVVTAKDSVRKYVHTGEVLTYIKWTVRDTVVLTNANYFSNQIFKFKVTASGADTTVFIATTGNLDAGTSYTMTGTNNSITWWYDGTDFWVIK